MAAVLIIPWAADVDCVIDVIVIVDCVDPQCGLCSHSCNLMSDATPTLTMYE